MRWTSADLTAALKDIEMEEAAQYGSEKPRDIGKYVTTSKGEKRKSKSKPGSGGTTVSCQCRSRFIIDVLIKITNTVFLPSTFHITFLSCSSLYIRKILNVTNFVVTMSQGT